MHMRLVAVEWRLVFGVAMVVTLRMTMLTFRPVLVVMFLFVPVIATRSMSMLLRFILIVRVSRALVNSKFDADHVLPRLPLEVHVEIAELHFGEFPFKRGGLHSQIGKRADHHVAADARETVEVENFHKSCVLDAVTSSPSSSESFSATSERVKAPS